jgi:hypothetical protein
VRNSGQFLLLLLPGLCCSTRDDTSQQLHGAALASKQCGNATGTSTRAQKSGKHWTQLGPAADVSAAAEELCCGHFRLFLQLQPSNYRMLS